MANSDDNGGQERQAFRINDEVMLYYRIISDEEAKQPPHGLQLPSADASQQALINSLNALNREGLSALSDLSQKNAELARILTIFDNKIRLLAKTITFSDLLEVHEMTEVSLSETGIAFCSPKEIPLDTKLYLQILLQPSFQEIIVFGNVVSSQASADNRDYLIGVSFSSITPLEQQWLSKHILQAQTKARKDRQEETF